MDDAKTYQARFRVDSSFFTLDLNAPLSRFWGDIIVSFSPPSLELTGLYAGLQFTGPAYGDASQVRRLLGPRCKALLHITSEEDVQIETLMFALQEMDIRRVILTEPTDIENATLFVSNLVEMSLDFLGGSKREVCYSTTNSSLYELAFWKLTKSNKPMLDEANAVIDEDALLRFMLLSLQCERCHCLSMLPGVTECCRRLYCTSCIEFYRQCPFCNSPLIALPATVARMILAGTELTCGCEDTVAWRDLRCHAATCSYLQVSCGFCKMAMQQSQYLQHLTDCHAQILFVNRIKIVSGREQLAMNLSQGRAEQPPSQKIWTCGCGNANLLSIASCIRCGMPRR